MKINKFEMLAYAFYTSVVKSSMENNNHIILEVANNSGKSALIKSIANANPNEYVVYDCPDCNPGIIKQVFKEKGNIITVDQLDNDMDKSIRYIFIENGTSSEEAKQKIIDYSNNNDALIVEFVQIPESQIQG